MPSAAQVAMDTKIFDRELKFKWLSDTEHRHSTTRSD